MEDKKSQDIQEKENMRMKELVYIRKFSWSIILNILLIIIFVNCENNIDFEPQFNVACILSNDKPYPYVIVDRTYSMDEPAKYDLQDVFGYISGPGIVDTLVHIREKLFRVKNPIFVQPESIYSLYLEAHGIKPLTGHTRVPGRFKIISPLPDDTITLSDSLVFTKSRFEAGYYLCCRTKEAEYYSVERMHPPQFTNDTILKFPVEQFYHYITQPGYYQFYVIACDTNYFNYRNHWEDNGQNAPPKYGIENGIGFFGSTWVESVNVYVKVDAK